MPRTRCSTWAWRFSGRRAVAEAATAALPYYQRAAALNPHDPDIEAALAQAFDILGEGATAHQHARNALALGASESTANSLREMLNR